MSKCFYNHKGYAEILKNARVPCKFSTNIEYGVGKPENYMVVVVVVMVVVVVDHRLVSLSFIGKRYEIDIKGGEYQCFRKKEKEDLEIRSRWHHPRE